MLITHHNKEFNNEYITVNGNHFEGCNFKNCILHCVDSGDDPDGYLRIINCNFVPETNKLTGPGWPYEFIELFNEGVPFTWSGNIGNKEKTLH